MPAARPVLYGGRSARAQALTRSVLSPVAQDICVLCSKAADQFWSVDQATREAEAALCIRPSARAERAGGSQAVHQPFG